jgi:nucleotide-binding universal stress UspA family protein
VYKHILVPTDGSELSLKAVRAAARLARPLKSRITALHVLIPFSPPPGYEAMTYHVSYTEKEYAADMAKLADPALDQAVAAARGAKVSVAQVVHPNPWEAIVKTARAKKCDLIVMASHGRRGLAGLILGSETQKVLTHSKTPVLVCR